MEKFMVIGNPIGHSISPQLHAMAFEKYGVDERYGRKNLETEELKDFVLSFTENGGMGFNVTVPHKREIMQYLDGITPEARAIGAVNTVAVKHGMTYGYNTDGDGFIKQLESDDIQIENARVKVIGAGGAARGIVYALVQNGARTVTVYNRTPERARVIANACRERVIAMPLDSFEADHCDILVNTTSVGMSPDVDRMPVDKLDKLMPGTAVVDIIYSPERTKLLQAAAENGNRVFNGLKMLIYQGLIANDIWLGNNTADDTELVDRIYNTIRDEISLKGNK